MSIFNRKGTKSIKARDSKTGSIMTYPARPGSAALNIDKYYRDKEAKLKKNNWQEFKKHLREAKKNVPLAERSKVNWSQGGLNNA